MDELGFYVSFNSIAVISDGWKGEHEMLCAMNLISQYPAVELRIASLDTVLIGRNTIDTAKA